MEGKANPGQRFRTSSWSLAAVFKTQVLPSLGWNNECPFPQPFPPAPPTEVRPGLAAASPRAEARRCPGAPVLVSSLVASPPAGTRVAEQPWARPSPAVTAPVSRG